MCEFGCGCVCVCLWGNVFAQGKPWLTLIIWLRSTGAKFTHLMAEVLLPTGLTGRGLITGKSAWLLTRAPFWITPRGTTRERAADIRIYTHRSMQHTNQFQSRKETQRKLLQKPNRTSIRPGSSSMSFHWPSEEANRAILMSKARLNWAGKRHKWVKAAANHSITNDRWARLNPACLMLWAAQQAAGT